MKARLLFKQSFRDFASRIFLYLTFTLFLILALSVSLGMMSFSYGFRTTFNETLGNQRVNARLQAASFLPAWVETEQKDIRHYYAKEKTIGSSNEGFLFKFMTKLLASELASKRLSEEALERLLLGVGYHKGNAWILEQKNLLEDPILREHFPSEEEINEYNRNVTLLSQKLNIYDIKNPSESYQTKNLVIAYLIDKISSDPNLTLGGFRLWRNDIEILGTKNQLFYWEYLKIDPSMQQVNDETPKTLWVNPTNTQKVWKSISLNNEKYHSYWDERRFIYVQPYFLNKFHLKLGDTINLRFKTWDNTNNPGEPFSVVIAGVVSNPNNISLGLGPTFSLPYHLVYNQFQKHEPNSPPVFLDAIYFNVKSVNGDLRLGQIIGSELFNDLFENLRFPGVLMQTSTSWAQLHEAYAYEFSQVMFQIIAYSIGFFTFGLLFAVFYFITQQIVHLQRKTLFFLKAIGVNNNSLSLLVTFSMFPLMLIGITVGFFGSLGIQNMMYNVAFEKSSFWKPFFSFNFVYFLVLIAMVIVSSLVFYLINTILLKSKILTIEGMNRVKKNSKSFLKIKTKLLKNSSSKTRIGLSFAFKNIYKNLISYLILSITFAIILFSTQFNKSLNTSAYAYEKWNQPYKSVFYADGLKLFALTTEENNYLPQYEVIDRDTLKKLEPIKTKEELYGTILQYQRSLKDPNSKFNWKDYYIDQSFTKNILSKIIDDPNAYNEFIEELTDLLEKHLSPVEKDTILKIIKLIDSIINNYRFLQDNYHYNAGFNILMGRTLIPKNTRAVLSVAGTYIKSGENLRLIGFEENDQETKKHFGFEEIQKLEDYIVEEKYEVYNPLIQKTSEKTGKLLRVNISSYFQSISNIRRGDVINLKLSGFKNANDPTELVIPVYVDRITKGDTISSTIFTSQSGLLNYLVTTLDDQIKEQPDLLAIKDQKDAYEKLLKKISKENSTLSNTAYDIANVLPWGIRYLTMPIFHNTSQIEERIGSRIEDFYDNQWSEKYFKNLQNQAMIFNEITKRLLKIALPFISILKKFIIIFIVISFAISSILITLVLLENREVILLFKAMGYKKSEINWYLISGYFVATIFATLTAIFVSLLVLNLTKGFIARFLSTSVYFVWSWEFILLSLALAGFFCAMIAISIVVFTNLQKPRNAFSVL